MCISGILNLFLPVSQLSTVCFVTPSFLATSSCVYPAFTRAALNVIFNINLCTPFIFLFYLSRIAVRTAYHPYFRHFLNKYTNTTIFNTDADISSSNLNVSNIFILPSIDFHLIFLYNIFILTQGDFSPLC